MEREEFFSGYCRCIDGSRMVAVLLNDGQLADVDCNFGVCPYEQDCALAQKIRDLLSEEKVCR